MEISYFRNAVAYPMVRKDFQSISAMLFIGRGRWGLRSKRAALDINNLQLHPAVGAGPIGTCGAMSELQKCMLSTSTPYQLRSALHKSRRLKRKYKIQLPFHNADGYMTEAPLVYTCAFYSNEHCLSSLQRSFYHSTWSNSLAPANPSPTSGLTSSHGFD